jgi:type IV pilus assembly protein PilA
MNTMQKKTRRQRPNGFTLMELLIVISIMLILMLLAIPSYNSVRILGNESSAMSSMQAINQAQQLYHHDYPNLGYACNLSALGSDPTQTVATATAARVLQGDLPSGTKSGYTFNIVNCVKAPNSEEIVSFEVTGVPISIGKTGKKGYCMNAEGEVKTDPTGGTNCTQSAK